MKAKLLKDIQAFLERHGVSKSRFGRDALKDSSFVFDLEDPDRDVKASTVERVRTYMQGYAKKKRRKIKE